jgi:hypothetical protein
MPSSLHSPTTGLEVFVEVWRETVYDPERSVAPTRVRRWEGRLAHAAQVGSNPCRCERV